jgi:hypothetical protein
MLETMRKTAGGIAVLLLLAMPPTAGAQTLDPASLHEVDNRIAAKAGMGHEGRSVAQIERMTVLHHGRVIGRIQEVLPTPRSGSWRS